MNKTININLANLFFHIDDDAYRKLHSYLEAIKHSLNNSAGSEEILADIEGRIAELFQEKLKNEQQVITNAEVDEVIGIMGQPEDYRVDEEIFEDELKPKKKSKKLYRDTENKYIGGISAGMAHYMGVNPWWIRLLWILLTFASAGGFIVIYILLLFLIPQAETTAQKLDMRGEAVNISNIEKKVKESFDTVADKVKNADINNAGQKFKSSTQTFFDAIGNFFRFIFKSIGKFIGLLFILVGGTVLISLFISLFAIGFTDAFVINDIPFFELVNTTDAPIWLLSILSFFLVGIPFFFILYLGLKIVVSNLKSIGAIAKFTLLGVWLASIIGITVLGIREAKSHLLRGTVSTTQVLDIAQPKDTLVISTKSSKYRNRSENLRINGVTITLDDDGNRLMMDRDFSFNIIKSEDSIARITIEKSSQGPSFKTARKLANTVDYNYSLSGNRLALDDFLTLAPNSKIRDQEVNAIIYLPVGTVVKFEKANYYDLSWNIRVDQSMGKQDIIQYAWKIGMDGRLECLDCPVEETQKDNNEEENEENGSADIKINEDGTEVKTGTN